MINLRCRMFADDEIEEDEVVDQFRANVLGDRLFSAVYLYKSLEKIESMSDSSLATLKSLNIVDISDDLPTDPVERCTAIKEYLMSIMEDITVELKDIPSDNVTENITSALYEFNALTEI